MVRVYNKKLDKDIPPDAVYVGRPSKWGNPFKIGKDGTREEVIEKYFDYAVYSISINPQWLEELKGKDLVCWCAPLPCHADVLLELANKCEEPHCFLPLGHEGLHQAMARIYDITEENE